MQIKFISPIKGQNLIYKSYCCYIGDGAYSSVYKVRR